MSGKSSKKRSETDWDRVLRMRDEDIDFTDNPPLDEKFFQEAIFIPAKKKQITLRLDSDILAFFRKRGRGYQTAINAVLRRYIMAQQTPARRRRSSHAAD